MKSIARILGAAAFKVKGAWTRALVSILNEVHVKMERGDLTADKASGRGDVPPVVAEHDGHGTAAASTAVGMNAFVATASCAEATTLSELSSSAEQPEWNVNDKVVTASRVFKGKHDNRLAVVQKVLSKKLRVKLLDGEAKGKFCDFAIHNCKKQIDAEPPRNKAKAEATALSLFSLKKKKP